jgi:hypothetical protein
MTVEVSMTAKTVKDTLVVPAGAVFKSAEGADYVLLAGSDNLAHQKNVQVGVRNAELAQILTGINAGDPVITAGGYAVPDKTQIKIEKPGEGEKEGGDKADADDKSDEKGVKDDKKDDKKDEKPAGPAKPSEKGKE